MKTIATYTYTTPKAEEKGFATFVSGSRFVESDQEIEIEKNRERAIYESLGMSIALQLVLEANDENDLLAQRNSLPLYQYTK